MTRRFTPEERARCVHFLEESRRPGFWAQVDKRGPDECWEWTGSRKPPHGYGHVYLGAGRHTTASRVALALTLGRLLARGESACHTCDNPPCCNPAHLFVGSQSDNAYDMVAKGRANRARGEDHREAKLTVDRVREIRARPYYFGLDAELARKFGVTSDTIRSARLGVTWRHVE